jgi:glucose/mannose-6-phosphate isomerase
VGFPDPQIAKQALAVLLLRSSLDLGRYRVRWEVTKELLDRAGIEHHTLELPGRSPLSEVLQMTYVTDHVSFYVALLNGADPSPNTSIDFLKDRLAQA